ncbi:MAG: DrmE family protein [Pyrinomonadaceae bacterium]
MSKTYWENLTLKISSEYPFIPKFHFCTENSEGFYPLPVLLQLASYSALSLTEPERKNKRLAVFFPYSDSIDCWVTAVAALAAISIQATPEQFTLPELIPGSRVLVDGADHIYKGTEVHSGTDLYVFEYANGIRKIPLSQRFRIQPSVSGRQLTKKGKAPIRSFIDGLLGTQLQGNTSMLRTSIILISSVNETKEIIGRLKFACDREDKNKNSEKAVNAFGWANLTSDGEVRPWGSSGKDQEPVVLVGSNLSSVNDYLEYDSESLSLIIIEGSSHLRDHITFQSLVAKNIPVMLVLSAKDIDCIKDLKASNFDFWTWSKDELKTFCSEVEPQKDNVFFELERKINTFVDFEIKTALCSNSKLEESYELLDALKSVITEDDYHAIQIIEQLFFILIRVTRIVVITGSISAEIKNKLSDLEADSETFQYLIKKEQYRLILESICSLREGIDLLEKSSDAKPEEIIKLVKRIRQHSKGSICIILGNIGFPESKKLLRGKLSFARNIFFETSKSLKPGNAFDHLILSGYLKRHRMLDVFDKVSSENLTVLGYPYEQDWIKSVRQQFDGLFRNTSSLRTFEVFTGASTEEMPSLRPIESEPETVLKEPAILTSGLGEFEIKLNEFRRQRILRSVGDDPDGNKTAANCVTFGRGSFAFLTEHYSVPAVTNLLDKNETIQEIPHKKVKDIQEGDLLLFRESSSQNIIREMADFGLKRKGKAEIRKKANRWRAALVTVYEENDRNLSRLMESLAEYGCKRNAGTVKNWLFNENLIAPRDENDIIAITVAAGDDDLDQKLHEIHSAIAQVRSAHIQASHQIIKQLNAHLVENLSSIESTILSFEIEGLGKVFLVRVESVAAEQYFVPVHKVNRLLNLTV